MPKATLFTALLLCLLPCAVRADVLDDFTFTGPGLTVTYSEAATFTTPDFSLWSNYSTGVTATVNGTPNVNISVDYFSLFYPQESYVVTFPLSTGISQIATDGTDVFTFNIVPATNPPPYLQENIVGTFVPGTYTEFTTPTAPGQNPVAYTLKITQETVSTTSVTPEPSSLLLLATGTLAAGTHLRRRRLPTT